MSSTPHHLRAVTHPKVPLTNEYSFLSKVKQDNGRLFKMRTEFSRALYQRIFAEDIQYQPSSYLILDNMMEEEFRRLYKDSTDLLAHPRLQALNGCFQKLIISFKAYESILTDIQREYIQIIAAMHNIMNEKMYLCSKIHKLVVEYASKERLEQEQIRITALADEWDKSHNQCQIVKSDLERIEMKFVESIGKLYKIEAEKGQDEKRKKDIRYLGRWQFTKDWLEERAKTNDVLNQLYQKLLKNPTAFRQLFQDEEIIVHEYDSQEMRKLKHHIEDQKKLSRNYTKDLLNFEEKKKNLLDQIEKVTTNIKDITRVLESKRQKIPDE